MAGALYCWGHNWYGQTDVPDALGAVSQVSAGREDHTCAVTAGGTLHCRGRSVEGQTDVPSDLGAVSQVSVGGRHTCAITAGGALHCWGNNPSGETDVPDALGTVSQVSASFFHTCALTEGGALHCWGGNASGEATIPRNPLAIQTATIRGRVTDAAGAGLAGVTLAARGEMATTDATGSYTLTNVPQGSVTLVALPTQRFAPPQQEFVLTHDVAAKDFVLVSELGALAGQVRNETGAALRGVRVQAQLRLAGDEDRWLTMASALSDAEGRYSFSRLPVGSYRVSFFDPATHRSQFYNRRASAAQADLVAVVKDATTNNIDALFQRPLDSLALINGHGASVSNNPTNG
ncbi:MAG: hypothetical protein EI684_05625, partial [Candidatus Viridilinea halotolerans]